MPRYESAQVPYQAPAAFFILSQTYEFILFSQGLTYQSVNGLQKKVNVRSKVDRFKANNDNFLIIQKYKLHSSLSMFR